MALSRGQVLAAAATALVVAGVVIAAVTYFLHTTGPNVVWEIRAGFTGWVLMRWERPECPALRTQGGQVVITIPPSGCACTSSQSVYKKARAHRFEYVYPDGTRTELPTLGSSDQPRIWAQTGESLRARDGTVVKYSTFFVGTLDELNVAGRPPDDC